MPAYSRILLPWDSQPQETVGIDWSNPIAQGLSDALINHVRFTAKLGTPPSVSGTVTTVAEKDGLGRNFTTGANRESYGGAWKGKSANFTILAFYRLTSAPPAASRVFSNFLASSYGWSIAPNNTNFRAIVAYPGANVVLTGSAVGTAPKVDVITSTGTATSYYENGVLTASNASHTAIATPTNDVFVGDDGAGIIAAPCTVYMVAVWDRILSSLEIANISSNPWQLFAPRSIWVPVSAPAATTTTKVVKIEVPWDRQPQERAEVDWGNPTTSGLVFAWEGSVPSHDLRSSVSTIPFSTGISSSASTHGRTVAFSGSQADKSFGLSTFNGLAAATGATYDILVYFSGANPTAKFFSQWDLGGLQRWTLECSSGNLVWVAGDTDGGGGSRSRFDLTGAFPAAGWYRITASWSGAGINSLWINGTKRSPSTVSSGCTVINSTTMGLFIGGSGSSPLNGAVAFARIWRRGLQDAEIASIQNSGAWQLFAPRTIFVPITTSSGGTTYTITPSGGIVFSGTGTEINTKVLDVSGGVTFAGTGSVTFASGGTSYIISPSGGVTLAGTGTQVQSKVIIPSGGISFAGTGLDLRTKVIDISGGVTFGGTGSMTSNTIVVTGTVGERTKVGVGT